MREQDKTREELIEELSLMRLRTAELEKANADKKRVEAELLESREFNRILFAQSPVPLVLIDAVTGEYIDFNDAALQIAGIGESASPDAFAGKQPFDFAAPAQYDGTDSAIAAREHIENCLRHGHDAFEWRNQRPSGEFWDAEVHLALIQDRGKEIILCSVQNITERKQAEQALRESEEKFSAAFRLSPVMLVFSNVETGRIIEVNEAFLTSTGYSMEEAIGKTTRELHLWVHLAERERLMSIIREKGECVGVISQMRCRDGSIRDVRVSSRIIPYFGVSQLLTVVEDMTESRQAEEALRHLSIAIEQAAEEVIITDSEGTIQYVNPAFQRITGYSRMEAIGTLAGGIAHDFNNILGAIIGYAELCLEQVRDRPRVFKGMEQVLMAADRAKELVQQIMTFSRRTEQEIRPTSLVPLVKEVARFMRASLPRTIEIRQNLDATSAVVMADLTQMHQVLMNLCTNAGYAMRDTGGVLELDLREVAVTEDDCPPNPTLKAGRYLQLTIADTGQGILPEHLDRIFEPYFTTKEKGEGTGLGLSVVDGIVRKHGGDIRVQSEVGRGTVCHVLLPLVDGRVETAGHTGELELPRGGEMILFVDDEPMLAHVGKLSLEALGYRVVAETDPAAAVETFRRDRDAFDLVITDKTMPHMTGFDLAREIRGIRGDIPVILCSGFMESDDMTRQSAHDISHFITKPIIKHEWATALRMVLDGKAGAKG